MKTILPWILVVAFGASAGALYFSSSNKEAELEKVRAEFTHARTTATAAAH